MFEDDEAFPLPVFSEQHPKTCVITQCFVEVVHHCHLDDEIRL